MAKDNVTKDKEEKIMAKDKGEQIMAKDKGEKVVEAKDNVTKDKGAKTVDAKDKGEKDNGAKDKGEKMLLSAVVKTMKAVVLKANGGKRPLNPVARKSRATKALVGAMLNRGWAGKGNGVYELSGVKVQVNTNKFAVEIHDGKKSYELALGKGAIIELDSYMKLR
jgi:hypothetical protein